MFVTVGGAFGALMVIYEVRLTKRLAQAEFIRELQSGFTSDPNVCALWSKLLLGEEITPADRPLISSYLTFFETLQLLLAKNTLDLSLVDDLFRNRFFTAVGNRDILDIALVREAGAFTNIHRLIELWATHLREEGLPIHPGYYAYVQAITEAKGWQLEPLDPDDLTAVLDLQERVHRSLAKPEWLRINTDVMWKECLLDHTTIGARCNGELAAVAVLYDGGRGEESIRRYFTTDPEALDRSINLKVVLVDPAHRRMGLACSLIELLEKEAISQGKREILCTIHPGNRPSRSLFARLGYHRVGTVETSYGRREVYRRELPDATKHWYR